MTSPALFVPVLLSVLTACSSDSAAVESEPAQNAIAVVELFTSEGCSSCPAAEKVFSRYLAENRDNDLPIYFLEYHVDYWNDIGWPDPFSSADYSKRQRYYAHKMNTGRVYTPQMVVNGTTEFVGSDGPRAAEEIQTALATAQPASLSFDMKPTDDAIMVTYEISGTVSDAILHIALVERDLVTDVQRGENRGRKLTHQNVVREFIDVRNPPSSGTVTLDIPKVMNRANSTVIVWLQDDMSARIVAASAEDLE